MIKSVGALLLLTALSAGQATASNVAFRGNLLNKSCHVSGDSLNRHAVFRTRTPRGSWYPPGRPPTESFVIRLENCHATAVDKTVILTFEGTEEAALPGHLKVTEVSAGRLGTTLLNIDGSSLLKLGISHNKGQGEKVTGNSLELPFDACVVATPEVLWAKSVASGDYETTVMFELTYRQQNFCIGYSR